MTDWNDILTNEDNPTVSGVYEVMYYGWEVGKEYYSIEDGWSTSENIYAWREIE